MRHADSGARPDRQATHRSIAACSAASSAGATTKATAKWVVTIRCGTVDRQPVRLFVGAGIVEDSSPESNGMKTGTKLSTILRCLCMNQEITTR
ncbi:chorismate-binding protein [Serratia ureilytica]